MAKINPIDLQKALSGVDYPAKRDQLVQNARKKKADDAVIDKLSHLKEDEFSGPDKVSHAVFNE
ncbi:DUF2795 domain-containing protein [Streptomyces aidingensis]|uniref:DUF2795 domain-containing protein n=1 Tax=Streptomyces aidingensis TaxID=910347 RepID=A0A1I1SKI4_9ACTN|nr:DUF2795 domain-containing protein [Streptomyces aidingensis]SFD46931.1 Protein of unknown function [Streptomyces aidingensis]